MAQHQDLCLLPALRPAQLHEQPNKLPIHDQIQQASRHEGSSSRTRRSTKREVTASFALSGTAQVLHMLNAGTMVVVVVMRRSVPTLERLRTAFEGV